MKKHRIIMGIFCFIWLAALVLYILPASAIDERDSDEVMSEMTIIQNEDKVGANISLKQAIHGTDGIHYRYIIKTDCPKWDFETRYMTDTPIEWVDGTSAVEVVIYDTQIRYNGTLYASGQYYTVPVLGNISSETISLDEWEQNLVKQAYQTYMSSMTIAVKYPVIQVLLFAVPFALIFYGFIMVCWKTVKENKADAKLTRQSLEYDAANIKNDTEAE